MEAALDGSNARSFFVGWQWTEEPVMMFLILSCLIGVC